MNAKNHHDPVQITPDPERLHLYHRQQLSVMLDGELAPDETRFMLRRLQHDVELARCWERWQVCGDVLRGRADDLLPADFAQRVARAIQFPEHAAATTVRAQNHHRWHWRGAVLAASLAGLVLWVMARDPLLPDAVNVADSADAADPAVTAVGMVPAVPAPVPFTAEAAAEPAFSAHVARAVELPRAAVRSTRPAVVIAPATTLTVDAAAGAAMPPAGDLLAPARQAPFTPRPWPRPLLPGAADGAVRAVVGYGVPGGAPLDVFQPRWSEVASPDWRTPPSSQVDDTAMPAAKQRP